jgi:hypothetical protein
MMVGIWAWSSGEIPAKSAIGDQVIISRPPRRLLVAMREGKIASSQQIRREPHVS